METRIEPMSFFCHGCNTWRMVAPADWGGGVRCVSCGDNFSCGDCGGEIDRFGTAFVELTVPDEPASHLTAAQDATLRAMCARFDVPYDPDKYHPTFDLPATWVAGWVGPIYVGVDPEGHAHT